MFRKIIEIEGFEIKGTVIVYDDRKYYKVGTLGFTYECAERKGKRNQCPGKIRVKKGYLFVIRDHQADCPTLTEKQQAIEANQTYNKQTMLPLNIKQKMQFLKDEWL